jgi:hypothetical protein
VSPNPGGGVACAANQTCGCGEICNNGQCLPVICDPDVVFCGCGCCNPGDSCVAGQCMPGISLG